MSQAATQDALLKWVNTFPIGFEVKALEDLNDGAALAKVMGDIDPDYKPAEASSPAILNDVINALFRYIRTNCEDLVLLLDTPGLKDFAKNDNGDTVELISTFLMAAIQGPARMKYLNEITSKFDPTVQSGLQKIIEQKFAKIEDNKDAIKSNTPAPFDAELEFEERYGSLLQAKKALEGEKDRLNRKIDSMQSSMDRLQVNYDQLKDECKLLENQLDEVASRGDTASMIEALKKDLQERDDFIASQEGALETNRVAKEKAQNEINSLKAASEELIIVKDELRSISRENAKLLKSNTELERKANMADHYRRKLETVRDYEGECAELKRINDELQRECEDVSKLRHQNKAQERRISDFERALSTNESEIYELTMTKKSFAEQNMILSNKVNNLEHAIYQLEEARNIPDDVSPLDKQLGNLEDELNEGRQGETDTMVIAALRTQIDMLKKNSSAQQDNGTLRNQIEDLERANKQLTIKSNEQFEKLAIAEQQVRAILDKSTGEGLVNGINAAMLLGDFNMLTPEYYRTQAFADLRKAYDTATEALTALQKHFDETKSELEQSKRDLLQAQTDLTAVEQSDLEALENLKNTQETITISLQNELNEIQNRYKNLDLDYQQQKGQLIDALLSKDELHKTKIQDQADLELLKQHRDKTAEDDRVLAEMEKMNAERVAEKEDEIESLKARIQVMVEGGSDPEQKESLEKENFNLKREYGMMATAWYDLTRRLQSNNVMLQRRQDVPRSWLNKQRQAVNPPVRR